MENQTKQENPPPRVFRGSRIAVKNQIIDELQTTIVGLNIKIQKLEQNQRKWLRFLDNEGYADTSVVCPVCQDGLLRDHAGEFIYVEVLEPGCKCAGCDMEVEHD